MDKMHAKLEAIRSIRADMLKRMKTDLRKGPLDKGGPSADLATEDRMSDDTKDQALDGLPKGMDDDTAEIPHPSLDTDGPEDLKKAVAEVDASENEYDGPTPMKKKSHYR